MKRPWAIAAATGLLVALVISGQVFRTRQQSAPRQDPAVAWAETATRECWTIQNRISAYGWEHWDPLARPNPPLARVAALRRELVRFQQHGLRRLYALDSAPTGVRAVAMRSFEHTLATTREVIRAAERGDVTVYTEADLRMRRSILATRAAFKRAGADYICDFAI